MPKRTQKRRLAALLTTGHGRWPARNPIELPLFDTPAVTQADIAAWIAAYASHIAPRYHAQYAHAYDLAGKIARDKAAGRWPPERP